MKIYYKIHVDYPSPITQSLISAHLDLLTNDFCDRLVIDAENSHIATIILSVDDSGNPEMDELSDFLLLLDDTDFTAFFGYPNEERSNAVTNEFSPEIWKLLDTCIVNGTTR